MQDEHMKQSINLAQSIQKHYVNLANRKNKGVHQAGFLVLRETSMPSVLTELGFITTPEEEAYLNSQDGINKLARSIFEGFLDYKQTQDGKIRPTISYNPKENTAESEVKDTTETKRQKLSQEENKVDNTESSSVLAKLHRTPKLKTPQKTKRHLPSLRKQTIQKSRYSKYKSLHQTHL